MTVAQLIDADLTEKQTAAVRQTVEHGGVATVDEIADGADISERTVRRTCDKLGQVIEIAAGKVRPADRVMAEKLRDVFNSIDQVIEQGKRTLRGLAGRSEFVEEDSPLGKWARRSTATADKTAFGGVPEGTGLKITAQVIKNSALVRADVPIGLCLPVGMDRYRRNSRRQYKLTRGKFY